MSEKLYRLLLRLYPARFRQEYGNEALRLFRERLRDERGFFLRLRLWLDLLADTGRSLPLEYRRVAPAFASAQLKPLGGSLSFSVLETEPLRRRVFLFGIVPALLVLSVFGFLLKHGGNPTSPRAVSPDVPSQPEVRLRMVIDAVSAHLGFLLDQGGSPRVPSAPAARALAASTISRPRRLSFVVASIRQSQPGTRIAPGFALDDGDSYAPFPDPHGRFTANFPLSAYILFAYKLAPIPQQMDSLLAHLPMWAATDYFEIQAKANGNPTKDQMRLMMQSLLADRFQLAVHIQSLAAHAPPDQPGLQVKPATAPLDILVIDHVERPSEN